MAGQGQIGMYTSPNGATVPGQQFDQNTQQMADAANTAYVQGNLNAMPSDQQLNNTLGAATTQLAQQQTPQSRQSYVSNSNIPAMQSNYSDLISQLSNYDKMVLAPQFQGQNPGTPSDAASFGRVDASNLTQLTPQSANLPPDQAIYNANPTYGMSSQIEHGNNIADLLGVLNQSIGQEFSHRTGQYASTVQSQKDVVDTILKVMGLKNDLAKSLSGGSGKLTIAQQRNQAVSQLTDFLESVQGKDKHVSPDDYAYAKTQALGLGLDPITFDKTFNRYRNPSNPYYQVEPGSLTSDQRKLIQTQADTQKAGQNLNSSLDDMYNKYVGMSEFEKRVPIDVATTAPFLAQDKAAMNTAFYTGIEEQLRKSVIGGRVTQQEISWLKKALLPTEFDTNESYRLRIDAAKREINKKLADPNTTIGGGSGGTPNAGPSPSNSSSTQIGRFKVTVH